MANRISLAGAIKSAAQSVTGETSINDVVEKRNHANSRISMGPGPNVRQANTQQIQSQLRLTFTHHFLPLLLSKFQMLVEKFISGQTGGKTMSQK